MIKNFFKLFRELVNDDENESLEILSKFLKSHDLHTRVQYLRYLLIEHENGVLEALHEYRYENDIFMWVPGTPIEEQDSQGIIDQTIEKVRVVLESHVPVMLAKAEQDEHYISEGGVSFLKQAQEVLQSSVDNNMASLPMPEAGPTALIRSVLKAPIQGSKAAAVYLGIAKSTFDKKLKLFPDLGYKMPGSRTHLFHKHVLDEFRDKYFNGPVKFENEYVKASNKLDASSDSPIVPHNRRRMDK